MTERIAIYGGSFNPPGLHHRRIAEALCGQFDRVAVVPYGPRPDQQPINDVEPVHRAALADIAFRGLPRVDVDLFDLEQSVFSRPDEVQARYARQGELWHVVGSNLIQGGENSQIYREWENGAAIWNQLTFAVVSRPGYELSPDQMPPHAKIVPLAMPCDGSSSTIRERIFKRQPVDSMVTGEVAAYIERYGLYRGRITSRATRFSVKVPRLLVFEDERNPRSVELAKALEPWEDFQNPNLIVVIGGDGTMLRAIRKHWRRRLPFFGINAGHLGFLLNAAIPEILEQGQPGEMLIHQLPMLYVDLLGTDGVSRDALAFNDAWIERGSSQSAWMEVKVNGRVRVPRLVSDGVLVATAAGSTAYARSMGASPLPVDTPAWLLVGSNVMDPPGWKSALLAMDANAGFTIEDAGKRPVIGFVDGQAFGEVSRMQVRMSRIASVELAFREDHDMAEKIADIQFPQIRT